MNFTNNGNSTNHVLAIEFDVFKNQEFNDINDNHVGVDNNSLTSTASYEAGYWKGKGNDSFKKLKLNNGVNYQVWIDCGNSSINITMAKVGKSKPLRPLINNDIDLSSVFLDEMYLGFTAATGQLVESHRILSWSFSNSNSSIGDALLTKNLPSFAPPKGAIIASKGFKGGVSVGVLSFVGFGVGVYVILVKRKRRKMEEMEEREDWEVEYWPHRIAYEDIYTATKGFSEENVIGCGGNGSVYRGVSGGVEIAVKRISHESEHGLKEFLAEISSLGRLKHRNLVGLRGWCQRDKGSLILVYDYMENGSLDKRIFECEESKMLSWEERVRVLKDVACGLLYLHEEWESRVLHRDIKASNVLLDKDMNARLADFGLARVHQHGEMASTTRVIGTAGYMSPEVVRTGRASTQTDVFSYGILVLEVVSGRRPIEEGKPSLIDWVWRLTEREELVCALDDRLKGRGGYSKEEVERMLQLGLLCAYPDPRARPTMRQVVNLLGEGSKGSELGGEGMEMALHNNTSTSTLWRVGGGGHPTFEEIRKSLSCFASLSGSDYILEGR